jgi:hypothetical protein
MNERAPQILDVSYIKAYVTEIQAGTGDKGNNCVFKLRSISGSPVPPQFTIDGDQSQIDHIYQMLLTSIGWNYPVTVQTTGKTDAGGSACVSHCTYSRL